MYVEGSLIESGLNEKSAFPKLSKILLTFKNKPFRVLIEHIPNCHE